MPDKRPTARQARVSAVAAALAALAPNVHADAFGEPPLCGASVALVLPCPEGSGECMFVGDNEFVTIDVDSDGLETTGACTTSSGFIALSLSLDSP
jgi:hypothetical protein